jgi:hypothetical protein
MLITRAGSSWVQGGGQQRHEEPREVEHALDVQVEHPVPRRVVEVGERRAPVGAGVVHEDVQRRLAVADLAGQAPALVLAGQVGGQAGARAELRQLGRHLVAHLGLARGHVDVGAGLDEPAGDHQPDAPGAPGDERGLAFDGEQVCGHAAPG